MIETHKILHVQASAISLKKTFFSLNTDPTKQT